jgi:type III secretory pathway component EscV
LLDKKSVTFCGRNLYVVPSKEHDISLAKVRQSVVKFRESKRLIEQLQKENEELMREKQEKETNLAKVEEILKIFRN